VRCEIDLLKQTAKMGNLFTYSARSTHSVMWLRCTDRVMQPHPRLQQRLNKEGQLKGTVLLVLEV